MLTKAEVGYLEAAAGFGTASAGYDDAIAAVLARSGGFFGPDGFYAAQAAFNAALKTPTPSFGPDGLLGGNTDRVMAGLNFTASGLALGGSLGIDAAAGVVAIIPGGQVVVGGVLIGTAAYFAGEFVYQHWGTIAGLGADAWHGIDSAGSWAGHQLSNIGGDVGKAFSWL